MASIIKELAGTKIGMKWDPASLSTFDTDYLAAEMS